jgi:hypothetical protein
MKHLTLLLAAALPTLGFAQVGVGTSSPDASAALEVSSTTKGFLPPRMTATQRAAISSPATGMMVYQTDGTAGLYVYSGSAWIAQAEWYVAPDASTSYFSLNKPANVASGALNNLGIGTTALNALTDGDNNTALGYDAAKAMTSNGNSTAVGYSALSEATGGGNTALGRAAGSGVTSGTNNTLIGNQSDVASNNLTNATALGYGATVDASNAIQLGNTSVTKVTTSGSVGIGTTAPAANAALEISSTSKGLLLPRMTTTQRSAIAYPSSGLLIYNSTTGKFQGYTDTEGVLINVAYDAAHWGGIAINTSSPIRQTFTATSNESLKSVVLKVDSYGLVAGTVELKLYSGSGVSGTLLATTTKSVSAAGYHTFTLGSPVALTSGDTYTLNLICQGSGFVYFDMRTDYPYAGGEVIGNTTYDMVMSLIGSGSWVDLH